MDDEPIEEMMQHLDEAKQLDHSETRRGRKTSSASGLQAKIQRRTDAAVLASNYEARLEELVSNDAVTHRSGKEWKSAKAGFDAHGRLPIYYRQEGMVTHTGYISDIVLNPDENVEKAREFIEHITEDDTYEEFNDRLDTTTFLVTDGKRLENPFPQSALGKLSDGSPISENYSRQPAHVVQRPGDFPDFP